jgi:hypothetical protein
VALRAEGADTVTAVAGQLRLDMKGWEVNLALPTWSLAGQATLFGSAAVQQQAGDDTFAISPEAELQAGPASAAGVSEAVDAGDLIYSASLGGTADDTGYGIAVDYLGNAYITGLTRSDDIPDTTGGYDPVNNGGVDEPGIRDQARRLGAVDYPPTLAGQVDTGWNMAVEGNLAYVVGETDSTISPGAEEASTGTISLSLPSTPRKQHPP